jgi:ABC transporter substrate binding protein
VPAGLIFLLPMTRTRRSAAQSVARSVPIVFVNVIDRVGMGIVASLSSPGGNITGFTLFEYGISGKLLELLKGIAPGIARVGFLRNPTFASAAGQLGAIQAVAPSFGIAVTPIDARDGPEVEHVVADFARSPNGGLIGNRIVSLVHGRCCVCSRPNLAQGKKSLGMQQLRHSVRINPRRGEEM